MFRQIFLALSLALSIYAHDFNVCDNNNNINLNTLQLTPDPPVAGPVSYTHLTLPTTR